MRKSSSTLLARSVRSKSVTTCACVMSKRARALEPEDRASQILRIVVLTPSGIFAVTNSERRAVLIASCAEKNSEERERERRRVGLPCLVQRYAVR